MDGVNNNAHKQFAFWVMYNAVPIIPKKPK
jgi:hypothetical protein